jgi:hypothetical protein
VTKQRFWWGLLAIFGVVAAAQLVQLLFYGCGRSNVLVNLIPAALGGGFGITLLAGVIPLVWLAFRRFDVRRPGPLQLWAVLALVFFAMSAYSTSYHYSVGDFSC